MSLSTGFVGSGEVASGELYNQELIAPNPPSKPSAIYNTPENVSSKIIKIVKYVINLTPCIIVLYKILELILPLPSIFPMPFAVFITIPIVIYHALYFIALVSIHPAVCHPLIDGDYNIDQIRHHGCLKLKEEGKEVNRFSVQLDGSLIDGMMITDNKTYNKNRCVVVSLGNAMFYEEAIDLYLTLAQKLNAALILYNYHGMGRSQGDMLSITPSKIIESSKAVLKCAVNEFGMTEVVNLGFSIGGGIQGMCYNDVKELEALERKAKFISIKDRSFSSIEEVVTEITGNPFIGKLVKLLGFDYNSKESSTRLKHTEIIIQANATDIGFLGKSIGLVEELNDVDRLPITDGIIPKCATLAYSLLSNNNELAKSDKHFFVVRGDHNEPIFLENCPNTQIQDKVVEIVQKVFSSTIHTDKENENTKLI